MRNPRGMYREPELFQLYLNLLSHKNNKVQKAALDCIITYKHEYLSPYLDHLYNLVNENNFKDELSSFRIDTESAIVHIDHRAQLMPFVLRIVFSKMFAKTGLRTGGKSSGQQRRSIILRFLTGCQQDELLDFTRMGLKPYAKYFNDDVQLMVDNITKGTDLERFLSPKKLQSTLNLIEVILKQLGGHMGIELLAFVLKVILVVGATVRSGLDQIENVHAGYTTILRNLRTSCIKLVANFFEHFEHYPWSMVEINAVFTTFIWPYLERLPNEGIYSPTSLLKLFFQWSSNPKYFPLLVKHKTDDKSVAVLPYISKLLLHPKCHISVTNVILEMYEKLLSLAQEEMLVVDEVLPLEEDILSQIRVNEKLNYGSCILMPHVPSILQRLKHKLTNKTKSINQLELFILSRTSELVWQPNTADTILELLLPVIIAKRHQGEEKVLKYVTTLYNLLQIVEDPSRHLKHLSPLFGYITHVSSRKVLCDSLCVLSKNGDKKMQQTAEIMTELNAWDKKWVDQPDFERRHNVFRKIQSNIDSSDLDANQGAIIIYNCYNIIQNESDLSLRENAAHCLRNASVYLLDKYKSSEEYRTYILNITLFTIIPEGLKSKNNELRSECILLLGHLAREQPQSHVVLYDLSKLTNKTDPEVDFFVNITHLQIYRHGKALVKFAQILKELTAAPNPQTLTRFILPLVSAYIGNEKYADKNSLIDSAIEAVGTIARLLPWHQYQTLLKYCLEKMQTKLDYQKQWVRLTVKILDSFHFDLSKGVVKNSDASEQTAGIVQDIKDSTISKCDEADQPDEVLKDTCADEMLAENDDTEGADGDGTVGTKSFEKIAVLCRSTATRVIFSIQVCTYISFVNTFRLI